MPKIPWSPKFEIGIASVDFEHRQLVDLVNAALDHLEAAPDPAAAAVALGELNAKIAAHFALEEKIMADVGYSDRAAHKADHERLLDDIRDIQDSQAADTAGIGAARLADRLEAWFSGHFRDQDVRFHDFLARR